MLKYGAQVSKRAKQHESRQAPKAQLQFRCVHWCPDGELYAVLKCTTVIRRTVYTGPGYTNGGNFIVHSGSIVYTVKHELVHVH